MGIVDKRSRRERMREIDLGQRGHHREFGPREAGVLRAACAQFFAAEQRAAPPLVQDRTPREFAAPPPQPETLKKES